ncbi:hypothetical protein LTS08_000645 [Lithohypha guttulata]|uniref:uncharacterized protein n=1 Tax=Lithohypha guttulata TaxID=1690604 RepID=UPI002DE03174|nr:hypothetical protein LTR51_007006 [Lithohypha guttulata]KAK5106526.1 hypothetical protein LTS08_000645 [Lithohypha guttulata]
MSQNLRDFKVDIPRAEVDRLLRKLKDTRIPTQEIVPGAGSDYGISTEWIREMYDYWINDFDWYKQQAYMNQWPHHLVDINDQTVHFVHARSDRADAIPILLIHGWPGSFYEFSQVINLLTKPEDPSKQAFHCVVPSLPGFCFSSGPPKAQTLKHVAGMFHELMRCVGYSDYSVQAGDWGHWVGRELAANPTYSKHVQAIHFNWIPAPLPPPSSEVLSPREQQIHERVQAWLNSHLAYAQFMRTRPSSLGVMLTDNPTAILSFIGEKYDEVCNPHNPLTRSNLWRDHILTTVCLYYFSNCSNTASLVYFENIRHEKFPEEIVKKENRVTVPMGYTSFLYDTRPSVRWGVEQTGNLVFYNERDEAGHFAALECPGGLVEDVRSLVEMVKRGEAKAETSN